jgi:hypothetical protein
MAKALAVGDPVLFYGRTVNVTALEDGLATVEDVTGTQVRDAAIKQMRELRARQVALTKDEGSEHEKLDAQIKEIDQAVREVVFRVRLRADLLSWWEERGVWVSDGRILSDDQIEVYKDLTGSKPLPNKQRAALRLIEMAAQAKEN